MQWFGRHRGGNTGDMGSRRLWPFSAALTLVALLAIGIAVSLSTGGPTSAKVATPADAQSPCAKRLLGDWADGRIDGSYPVTCYRVALKTLPADLEVYSSASEDISQALSQRIVQSAQKISGHQGATSVRKSASARASASVRNSSTRPARHSSRNVKPPR
jgi:hypothetical protein